MRKVSGAQDMEVEGVVELAATDLDGSIIAVNVKTVEGQLFLIDDTPLGNQLLKHVGRKVFIKGRGRVEDGLKILQVVDYLLK